MTRDIKKKDVRSKPKKFHVCEEWFRKAYLEDVLPTRVIAKEIGCCDNHITDIAKRFGIKPRGRLKRSVPYAELDLDIKEIVRLYVDEEMAADKIGELFGCTSKPIYDRLRRAGVKIRHHNDTKRGRPSKNKIYLDPEIVISMYMKKHESGQTVADHFGVSRQVVDRILKENGVEKKPMGETRDFSGENHPLWRFDLTEEEREKRRDLTKHAEWRDKIYERDGYTCQKCGDSSGGNLNAHHIIPHSVNREIAWELDNGICLCKPCHIEFHSTYGYKTCNHDDIAEFLSQELVS